MVELLFNDLMFADDICVFWPSVRRWQSILDVCQTDAESHEIIFNCSKTVCMTFKVKTAKRTVIPLLTLGSGRTKSKSVSYYKDLGIVRDVELSDDKDIQTQLRYQKAFSRRSNAVKNVLFRSFCTPMYASCDFRKEYFHRLFGAYNFGCKALYNMPWRASVSSHQVQYNIPTFEVLLR